MIIKGNSVGHPIPDPRRGLDMSGNMLTGLKAPVSDSDAATKGYVDANKIDKTQISDTYLEERAGYVLDARALKRAVDMLNGRFNIVRLWQNASPESTFDNQTVKITASPYNVFIIRFKLCAPYTKHAYGIGIKNNYGWLSAAMGSGGTAGAHTALAWREFAINSSGSIVFYDAHKDGNSLVDAPIEDNDWIVPYEIYGASGGITL